MKKKIIGVVLLIIGVVIGILGVLMIIQDKESGKLMKEAIYVGDSALQAENDGKIVIVTGELDLLEPAYDSELGITFYSPKVIRNAQNIKWLKNLVESKRYDEDMYGWEWTTMLSENNTYCGKAMVNEYKLSEDLLKNIPTLDVYKDYDESDLAEAKLILTEDANFTQKYFLEDLEWRGPENMGYYFSLSYNPENYDDVIRYYYSAYLPESHNGITVIGVQNGDTLDLQKDLVEHSFMDNKLTRDEVVKQFNSTNMAALIASIIISLGCILGGVFIIRRSYR